MPTNTTNYGYNKPNVNSADDEDLWGEQLNDNWDELDTDLKAVSDQADLGVTNAATAQTTADNAAPSGAVMAFATSTVPTGWLECDGSTVSRTTYADLFSAIGTTFGVGDGSTTFELPDLRGEFVRGWDNGKGTDSGRAFGSSQADQLASHTHTYDTSSGTGGSVNKARSADENFIDGQGTTDATGGGETRPRNIALMYCIKT